MTPAAQDYEVAKQATTAAQIAVERKGYTVRFETVLAMRAILTGR